MTGKQLYKLWREQCDVNTPKWKQLPYFDQCAWIGLAEQLAAGAKVGK